MFTGIVEQVGSFVSLKQGRLTIEADLHRWPDPVKLGESIANNGCCLTVVDIDGDRLGFDLSEETLRKTSLGSLAAGSSINLERAMRADGRFGGHIVQGHVDGTGVVLAIEPHPDSTVFTFGFDPDNTRLLIEKGSITVDGISLTVVDLRDDRFSVWVIPHTLAETNLGQRNVRDRVNLEFDVLAKYVARLVNR